MIKRQVRRLYSVTNNLQADLPLPLLDDRRLREIVCAYGGVYMLPVLNDIRNQKCYRKLQTAHRYLVANLSQYYDRSTLWDPENGKYENKTRYIYGRLGVKTLETMRCNQRLNYAKRFQNFRQSLHRN